MRTALFVIAFLLVLILLRGVLTVWKEEHDKKHPPPEDDGPWMG
jgi:hypothetical protein